MNVAIITGYLGQDGKYLSKFLHRKKYTVDGYKINVLDKKKFYKLLLKYKDFENIEIYNLAAKVNTGLKVNNTIETFHVNSIGILTILEVIKELKLIEKCKIFQASSSETIHNPDTIYSISKISADLIVKMYRNVHGFHISSGVLFSHESPYKSEKFVTPKIINGLKKVMIGEIEHVEVGNIDTYKDWGHAEDYVEAMWLILQDKEPGDYVVLTGQKHTIREMIELTLKIMGKQITWKGENINEVGIVDNKIVIKVSNKFYIPCKKETGLNEFDAFKRVNNWKPKYNLENIIFSVYNKK